MGLCSACPCVPLRAAGGWLHLHHNVTDREEAAWVEACLQELRGMAAAMGRDWQVGDWLAGWLAVCACPGVRGGPAGRSMRMLAGMCTLSMRRAMQPARAQQRVAHSRRRRRQRLCTQCRVARARPRQ